jgi:hypothetical protein
MLVYSPIFRFLITSEKTDGDIISFTRKSSPFGNLETSTPVNLKYITCEWVDSETDRYLKDNIKPYKINKIATEIIIFVIAE